MHRRIWQCAAALTLLLIAAPGVRAQALNSPKPKNPPREKKLKKEFAESAAPWAPPDVDAAVPGVSPSTPCLLPDVLAGASKRVEELVTNLQQFTAAEHLEHLELDKRGRPGKPQRRRFDYLVMIVQLRHGMLSVEEMRDGGTALDKFPANLATTGLPALALIFHPSYIEDFDMRCEGFGTWRGQPAWQVRFAQRADRSSRMRSYRLRGRAFPIAFKGRAWIAADSLQVVRLETDLLEAIPEIPLTREHMEIEYKPVAFKQKQLHLWLPESAELYMDFRGHRYHRRHSFSDFQLFSVDVNQQIAEPKQPQ